MSRRPLFPPVFAPNASHPMVDDFTLRAARQRAMQQPGLPAAYSVPLRDSPLWNGNPELGIEQPYQPDGDGFQTILKMGMWGPPTLWTVSLGITYNPALIPAVGDGKFSVDGLIRYGSGGVTQEFEVDWSEGTSFSLPMNAINVIARYSDFTGGKNNTPSDLRLRVNLAQGGYGKLAPTKSALGVIDTGGLNAQNFVIPKFARRLSVQRGSGSTGGAFSANMTYTFRGNATGGDSGGFDGAEFLANYAEQGVPIPPTARFVRVSNTTGSLELVWLIFHLAM
jgi:hypothetical protein